MKDIIYINRSTGQKEIEKVYGKQALKLIYGDGLFNRLLRITLLPFLTKIPLFSSLYGKVQKKPASIKKIVPFIKEFGIDSNEFLDSVSSFRSFNDFFIRRLKPEARQIIPGNDIAVAPADARYYFYQTIGSETNFIVKGQTLNLSTLLQDSTLAQQYEGGSLLVARLCPSDYHRFHFPCDCTPGQTRFINGWLYSVNPVAVKKNVAIFTQNKRTVCELETDDFGKVLYLEIGATNVGSIRETYTPFKKQAKGDEKGYFEFGASALILLFAPHTIQFDEDLLRATQEGFEIRCLLGQRIGQGLSKN